MVSASVRHVWLGLTPEPERELPAAVAALRTRTAVELPEEIVAAEDRRIEALILHGTQRSWLRYLREVTGLVRAAVERDESLGDALRAAETVLEHHRMLIGLPGSGYDAVAAERDELTRIVGDLRGRR
jgi:hypothetical protein